MYSYNTGYVSIPRVHAAYVRARWRFVADRVILLEKKVVVAARIHAGLRGVVHGAQSQGSSPPPTSHHLRRKQLFGLDACGVRLQVFSKLGNILIELPEYDISSVAPQDLGLRYLRHFTHLVGIPHHELTGF